MDVQYSESFINVFCFIFLKKRVETGSNDDGLEVSLLGDLQVIFKISYKSLRLVAVFNIPVRSRLGYLHPLPGF